MRNFQQPGRSEVMSTRAMVSTSHGLATSAALEILQAGGNAFDAAIAGAAMLAVVEPTQTGIGGDCFALFKRKGQPVQALNGAGWAPAGATLQYFKQRGVPQIDPYSADAITVPGGIAAWYKLSQDHGKLSFKQLLQPAILAAESGYPVTERLARDWLRRKGQLLHCRYFNETFYPNGEAPNPGEIHKQPLLAKALRSIAEEGADVFYKGWIAKDIVETMKTLGGTHNASDFEEYCPEYVKPIQVSYRGYQLWECPPSGQGIVALAMAKILERYNLCELDPLGPERLHLHAEASRIAYAERDLFLCDPTHHPMPLDYLLSDERASDLASRIKIDSRIEDLDVLPHTRHADTIYLSVVDEEGTAVSFINSIFDDFGSAILTSQSGIILHNRGSGFTLQEGHPNCIAGRKKPLHTIIPALLTKNDEVVMSFGVTGAHFQPMGQVQILTNVVDYGMGIQEAIDAPRFFAFEDSFEVEESIPEETVLALRKLGHEVRRAQNPLGTAQAIWIDHRTGVLRAGADSRRDGCALGY
ncbi:gamma-glutamyltransferase [Pseudomonas asiatica]|uniref:gamma-glutamyltransferase n=1 Tax=Pseudomonas asiatica TaxID=2219225 RepID=UPI0025AB4D6A|nr:gamma-glutamyltransferase [Pseudomonas asiatica]MDM9590481.1 gamma-glutamyltransferase [Pseudomonas asiatica]